MSSTLDSKAGHSSGVQQLPPDDIESIPSVSVSESEQTAENRQPESQIVPSKQRKLIRNLKLFRGLCVIASVYFLTIVAIHTVTKTWIDLNANFEEYKKYRDAKNYLNEF